MTLWSISAEDGNRFFKESMMGATEVTIQAETKEQALDKFISQLVVRQYEEPPKIITTTNTVQSTRHSIYITKCTKCGHDTFSVNKNHFVCNECGTTSNDFFSEPGGPK